MTREDLGKLKPLPWSVSYGKALVAVPMAAQEVLLSSPALALACLDALAVAVDLGLDDLADTLNLALVDAGVEDSLVSA